MSRAPMMTDDELDRMAAEVTRSLPSLATIRRSQGPSNEAGGEVGSSDVVGTAVPCRVSPGGSTALLRQMADRLDVDTPWTLTLPADTDCEPGDEVTVNNRRFKVIQPMDRDFEVSLRLLCDEVSD